MKKFPAVIVIHENSKLVPHIRSVAERMAREGFIALAPDALSPVGGTTKNFIAAIKYLKTNHLTIGKAGCTGFCRGVAMTNRVAVNSPDPDAAVLYYGMQPTEEQVAKIKAPVCSTTGTPHSFS